MKVKLMLLSASLLITSFFLLMPTTSHSQSTIEVADEMEVLPDTCGLMAHPIAIDPLIDQALGTWPIWVALPNSEVASEGVLIVEKEHTHTYDPLAGWWATKVAWFIPLSYTGEVHLRGYNLADESPIYFAFNGHEPTDHPTINPDQPGGFVEELDQFAFFPSHLWVSKAGCYRLEAEWAGGRWQQVIAVGSLEE